MQPMNSNPIGLWTLYSREVRRFAKVYPQTLMAPVVTTMLFLAVFTLALGGLRPDVHGVPFSQFLGPGLVMMAIAQNAFANTSSSIMISKIQGNIVDTLMPPLSAGELVTGYAAGGVLRGLFVGLAVAVALALFLGQVPAHPLWALVFILLGALFLGALGIVAAIFADKFDQMAAVTNFIVVPLSFLSGTFYSVEGLPGWMQVLTHFNPVFYLIDGVRYGYIGTSDSDPWRGLVVCTLASAAVLALCWHWFRIGYRLKP